MKGDNSHRWFRPKEDNILTRKKEDVTNEKLFNERQKTQSGWMDFN